MADRERHLARSILLALLSLSVTTAVLEVVFRVVAFRADERALREATRAAPPPPGSSVRLGHILRPSLDPRIVFELFPGLSVTFLGAPLVSDARGFRVGPEPASTDGLQVRIVGLGDSVMFGWGVGAPECYLSVLVEELNRARPEVNWTVVNTAVPGYNTVMEVQTLRTKALDPPPHLVILNFVGNDLRLPNFVLERRSYLSPTRSFLLDFVRSRLRPDEGDLSPHLAYLPRQRRPSDADRVPSRFRDLVGLGAFQGALDELESLADLHGFEVVMLAHPEAPAFVREAAAARQFPLVETGSRVQEQARARGLTGAWEPPLALTAADPHPSALGHELIARALLEALEATGLPARLADEALRDRGSSVSP
jgi:lysophospholipase L1-like esterase